MVLTWSEGGRMWQLKRGLIMQVRVSAIISWLFQVVWLTKHSPTILELNRYEGLGHQVGTIKLIICTMVLFYYQGQNACENAFLFTFIFSLGNKETIGHSGKYHNTLCLSPQILHKHCFQFLLGLTMVPRENKNYAYAKFGWTNKEYYGIFRNGQLENLAWQWRALTAFCSW